MFFRKLPRGTWPSQTTVTVKTWSHGLLGVYVPSVSTHCRVYPQWGLSPERVAGPDFFDPKAVAKKDAGYAGAEFRTLLIKFVRASWVCVNVDFNRGSLFRVRFIEADRRIFLKANRICGAQPTPLQLMVPPLPA